LQVVQAVAIQDLQNLVAMAAAAVAEHTVIQLVVQEQQIKEIMDQVLLIDRLAEQAAEQAAQQE